MDEVGQCIHQQVAVSSMELLAYVLTAVALATSCTSQPQTTHRPDTAPDDTKPLGLQPASVNEDKVPEQLEDGSIGTPLNSDANLLFSNSPNSSSNKNSYPETSQNSYTTLTTKNSEKESEDTSESGVQPLTENTLSTEFTYPGFFPNSGEQTSTVSYQTWELARTDAIVNEVLNESTQNTDRQRSRRPKLQLSKEAGDIPGSEERKEKSDAVKFTSAENRSSNTSAQGRSHKHHDNHHHHHHNNKDTHQKHRKHQHHNHQDYNHHHDRHHHHRRPHHGHKGHGHRGHHRDLHRHADYTDHVHFHDHSHEYPASCLAYPQSPEKYPLPPEKYHSKHEHSSNSRRSGHHGDHGHHSGYHEHHASHRDSHSGKYHFLDRHGHPDTAHSLYHRHKHYEHYHNDHHDEHDHYSHRSKHDQHDHNRDHGHSHHKGHDHHDDHHDCYDCHHEHHHHHDRRRRHRDRHNDDGSWNFGNIFKLPMIGHKISLGISGGIKKHHHH